MRAAEEAAFARGISAEALMDEAARGIARTVAKFFPAPGRCIVFAGKGNNAGDAFAAAALLQHAGWQIELRLSFAEEELGELPRKKLASVTGVGDPGDGARRAVIILDGLLGLGAKPPLREPIRSACREINRLRQEQNAFVFSIDLPTGLEGDSGETDEDCVVADFVVTIGFAKTGLLSDRATDHVGRLAVTELADLRMEDLPLAHEAPAIVATASSLAHLLTRRNFAGFKNQYGRVGVVAGSKGLTGAAVLCALGALRAGCGLLRVYVREDVYPIVAASAPPEAMVQPVTSYESLLGEPVDIWAVGPGLGRIHAREILPLIEEAPRPMVIDADGLNILSAQMAALRRARGPRLLTPHPGEMKRLAPGPEGTRAETVAKFCDDYPATILLKGSRSIIAERGQPGSYNTTGSAGMAVGGMGDALTGVCAGLMAQKLTPYDAARLGAWLCGRAAEIAIYERGATEQTLTPSDLLENLAAAFRDLSR